MIRAHKLTLAAIFCSLLLGVNQANAKTCDNKYCVDFYFINTCYSGVFNNCIGSGLGCADFEAIEIPNWKRGCLGKMVSITVPMQASASAPPGVKMVSLDSRCLYHIGPIGIVGSIYFKIAPGVSNRFYIYQADTNHCAGSFAPMDSNAVNYNPHGSAGSAQP